MIMSGMKLAGDVPFKTVYYHGMVRDGEGKKMSKTRGNAVDPGAVMDEHGVDALRFTLAALASPGSDVNLAEERLTGYRAFLNKLWNATRFLLMQLPEDGSFERASDYADEIDDLDRYLLAGYLELVDSVHRAYEEFRFDQAAEAIYHFLWNSYCDWSIELAKPDFADGCESRRAVVRLSVLLDVLDGALRLLHPIAPFITEELWQSLPRRAEDPEQLAIARIPTPEDPALPVKLEIERQDALRKVADWLIAPVSGTRSLKTGAGIAPGKEITLRLRARRDEGVAALQGFSERIASLVRASEVDVLEGEAPDEAALRQVLDTVEVIVPMAGAVDVEQERQRLEKERGKLDKELGGVTKKLSNPRFVEKAPAEVVEKERARAATLEGRLAEVTRLLEQLS